jgi:hypothetical protein
MYIKSKYKESHGTVLVTTRLTVHCDSPRFKEYVHIFVIVEGKI